MAKRPSNSRQSISSGLSIAASLDNITTFEEYLTMAHETMAPPRESSPPPPPVPPPPATKETKKSSKYGIHSIIARNKKAVSKKDNQNFIEMNKQKLQAEREQQREREQREREQREQRRPSTWRNLIKGVLDLQRGKIPLLLAVEAGNQSMVRELLSAQTAEQLQVSLMNWIFFLYLSNSFQKKSEFRKEKCKLSAIIYVHCMCHVS